MLLYYRSLRLILVLKLGKDDWPSSYGMNVPRMRRPEDPAATAGLMMEVWASVASWFLKPDGNNLLGPAHSISSSMANPMTTSSTKTNNCSIISAEVPIPPGPPICTAIRCTVPGCSCECFAPGKLHIRYCENCPHGWVPHALDKLGFRHIFSQTPVEPVQPNVAFDIASLVLYGCQALPIRLKILLDRLFSVLQKDEVTQILRGFGWTHEDYVRGYILQEAHGVVLDRWNICSPEEEPLVLQQFLRFGETRTITQQLLLHGLGDLRHLPRMEADLKKMMEKNTMKSYKEERSLKPSIQSLQIPNHKSRTPTSPNHPPMMPATHIPRFPPLPHMSNQKSPLNFVKLPLTGLTCTPVTTTNGPMSSPPIMSPLSKLQNMQPFDIRKITPGIFQSSKSSPERRRSEASDTSQTGLNLSTNMTTSPSLQPPPISVPSMSSSSRKSPNDFASKNSSDQGSEDGDDEEENSQSALNLSKDATTSIRMARQRHGHSRKTSTPMKRQWGSSNLPLNLGTQLINPATGKKRVQCNVCLKTFCDKGALKIHFSAVHLREMHKCTVEGCNMMFSSRRSRNRHSANPNPKLHSPHLRRKISPHDGRSAQAHSMLIPPLQAGLNPLSFGPFPLLTTPPDLRHQLPGLDLKHNFDFGSVRESVKSFDMSSENNDDYMDDDDEEGIVVDGAGVDDDENDSENSGEKAESTKSKRTKHSESDMDEDGISNTDSNESVASMEHVPKEENDIMAKSVHKRKSQNPTRCTFRRISDDEGTLSEEELSDEMSALNSPKPEQDKEWDLRKSQDEYECENNNIKNQKFADECLNLSTAKKLDERTHENERDETDEKDAEYNSRTDDSKVKNEPLNFAMDMEAPSPARSHESSGSCGDSDSENHVFGRYEDGNFVTMDVPLDKENPRKCTACGKVFQNHFGVKTHFQNVHLKLMHKCVVDGCNAAFPSKRSRDRHSSNLNLHRKLLSTSDSNTFSESSPFSTASTTTIHSDFLSRLYDSNPVMSTASTTTNGDLHSSLMLPHLAGLPFSNLNPFAHLPMLNGQQEAHLTYNIEEDLPVPNQDNVFHCRFCSKPFTEFGPMKEHYERHHLGEMFRCKVPGCGQVFSSRTKRNIHSENRLLHEKETPTS